MFADYYDTLITNQGLTWDWVLLAGLLLSDVIAMDLVIRIRQTGGKDPVTDEQVAV